MQLGIDVKQSQVLFPPGMLEIKIVTALLYFMAKVTSHLTDICALEINLGPYLSNQ